MILVNNKHEESKEVPEKGNLLFDKKELFSKIDSENKSS